MLSCTGVSCTERKDHYRREDLLQPLAEEAVDSYDEPRLIVSLCTAEETKDEGGETYTAYAIKCVMVRGANPPGIHVQRRRDVVSWMVKRRYSEFHTLHTKLKTLGKVRADLPSKNPLSKFSFTRVVQSREVGLQDYLNCVLQRCNDEQCVLLAKFLKVNKHLKVGGESMESTPSQSPAPWRHPGHEASSNDANSNASTPFHSALHNHNGRAEQTARAAEPAGITTAATATATTTPRTQQPTSVGADAQQQQNAILENLKRQRTKACPPSMASPSPALNPTARGLQPQIAGVGLFFVQGSSGACVIDEVIRGSSAEANGSLMVGDTLLSVDNVSIVSKDLAEIRNMIVGPLGTHVQLELQREQPNKSPLKFIVSLVRAVPQPAHTAAAPQMQAATTSSGANPHNSHASTPSSSASGVGGGAHTHSTRHKVLWNSVSKDTATPSKPSCAANAVQTSGVGSVRKAGSNPCAALDGNPPSANDTRPSTCKSVRVEQLGTGTGPGAWGDGMGGTSVLGEPSGMTCMSLASEGPGTVRAIYSFEALRPHELTLHKGELVVVTRRHESGWWEGCCVQGARRGWFPSNHVEVIDAESIVLDEAARATVMLMEQHAGHHEHLRDGAAVAPAHVSHKEGAIEHSAAATTRGGGVGVGAGGAGGGEGPGGVASSSGGKSSLSRGSTVDASQALSMASNDSLHSEVAAAGINARGHSDSFTAEGLDVDGVCQFLAGIDLGEYVEAFQNNRIDGDMLMELKEEELIEDFGMTNKYHRKRLLKRLHK